MKFVQMPPQRIAMQYQKSHPTVNSRYLALTDFYAPEEYQTVKRDADLKIVTGEQDINAQGFLVASPEGGECRIYQYVGRTAVGMGRTGDQALLVEVSTNKRHQILARLRSLYSSQWSWITWDAPILPDAWSLEETLYAGTLRKVLSGTTLPTHCETMIDTIVKTESYRGGSGVRTTLPADQLRFSLSEPARKLWRVLRPDQSLRYTFDPVEVLANLEGAPSWFVVEISQQVQHGEDMVLPAVITLYASHEFIQFDHCIGHDPGTDIVSHFPSDY